MAKEAVLQVRMDADLKLAAENLFRELGTSFAEVVRLMAKQSVLREGIPFTVELPKKQYDKKRIGILAHTGYKLDDIDQDNKKIEEMFEGYL